MITKDWKVAKVLDMYPATLNTFLEVSPLFSKLKTRVLRKTIARSSNPEPIRLKQLIKWYGK